MGEQVKACTHIHLSKKKSGTRTWYQCDQCPQKFRAEVWDGKVKVTQIEGLERCLGIGDIQS